MARVLLVEDHQILNRYLCAMIRERGHDVDCVKTRKHAIGALKDHGYDIIVCDLVLPDGNGHEVLQTAADLGIKAIAITGHPDEFEKLQDAGVACLYKPFSQDQLFAAIDSALTEFAVRKRSVP